MPSTLSHSKDSSLSHEHFPDLQATFLYLCGIQHERFTYRHQGLDFRLTGVEPCKVVKGIRA